MEPASYVVDAVSRLQRAVHQMGNLRLEPWQMSLSGDAAGPGHMPPPQRAQLARRCFVRPHTMTRIVSALEQRGLVEPQPRQRTGPVPRRPPPSVSQTEMAAEVNKINATITPCPRRRRDRRARQHAPSLRPRGRDRARGQHVTEFAAGGAANATPVVCGNSHLAWPCRRTSCRPRSRSSSSTG